MQAGAAVILKAVPDWLARDVAMPKNEALCKLIGCRKTALRSLLAAMEKAGLIELEITDSSRRVRLPGGDWTKWAHWTRDARLAAYRKRGIPWRTRMQQARAKQKRLDEGVPRTNEQLFGSYEEDVLLLRRRGYAVTMNKDGSFTIDGRKRSPKDLKAIAERNGSAQTPVSPFVTRLTGIQLRSTIHENLNGSRRRRAVNNEDGIGDKSKTHKRQRSTAGARASDGEKKPKRQKRNGGSKSGKPPRYPRGRRRGARRAGLPSLSSPA